MMIIWQGFGFLGALIPIGCYVLSALVVRAIAGADYLAFHSWPGALGTLVGGGLVWLLGEKLNDAGRSLVDTKTGQTVVLKKRHTLFFIPLKIVAIALAVIAIGILFFAGNSSI
jgi:hypothetical protein